MRNPRLSALALILALLSFEPCAARGVIVIGHEGLPKLDDTSVERIYKGRKIEVDGINIKAIDGDPGSMLRKCFVQAFLKQSELDFDVYWRARTGAALGTPPRRMATSVEIINFVRSTPGAIGYIVDGDIPPGVVVLSKGACKDYDSTS